MQAGHGLVGLTLEQQGQDLQTFIYCAANQFRIAAIGPAQYVRQHPGLVPRVADSYSQPQVVTAAKFFTDVPQPLVAAMTAACFQANYARIQIYLIVDNQDPGRFYTIIIDNSPERAPAAVHIRCRLEKQAIHARRPDPRNVAGELFIGRKPGIVLFCQSVDKPETGIVARCRIIRAGITQARNEFQSGPFDLYSSSSCGVASASISSSPSSIASSSSSSSSRIPLGRLTVATDADASPPDSNA